MSFAATREFIARFPGRLQLYSLARGLFGAAKTPRNAMSFLLLAGLPTIASAGSFAAGVISYTPGSSDPKFPHRNSRSWRTRRHQRRKPRRHPVFRLPQRPLTLLPRLSRDEIVQIRRRRPTHPPPRHYVNVGAGKRLGVISNVGLVDASPTFHRRHRPRRLNLRRWHRARQSQQRQSNLDRPRPG